MSTSTVGQGTTKSAPSSSTLDDATISRYIIGLGDIGTAYRYDVTSERLLVANHSPIRGVPEFRLIGSEAWQVPGGWDSSCYANLENALDVLFSLHCAAPDSRWDSHFRVVVSPQVTIEAPPDRDHPSIVSSAKTATAILRYDEINAQLAIMPPTSGVLFHDYAGLVSIFGVTPEWGRYFKKCSWQLLESRTEDDVPTVLCSITPKTYSSPQYVVTLDCRDCMPRHVAWYGPDGLIKGVAALRFDDRWLARCIVFKYMSDGVDVSRSTLSNVSFDITDSDMRLRIGRLSSVIDTRSSAVATTPVPGGLPDDIVPYVEIESAAASEYSHSPSSQFGRDAYIVGALIIVVLGYWSMKHRFFRKQPS